LRAYGLTIIRMGTPEGAVREEVIRFLDARYPEADEALNRERGQLLAALEAPGIVGKMLTHLATLTGKQEENVLLLADSVADRSDDYGQAITNMRANMPRAREIDVVMSLRHVRTGWTLQQRETYFRWFYDALRKSGGMSYVGFLENMRADALENVPAADREALADLTDAYSVKAYNLAGLPQPEGPGKNWNRQEIGYLLEEEMSKPRNFEQGQKMYAAALCQACHRFKEQGGLIGPDLTTIGSRFSTWDIVGAIDSPSDAISDQYAAELITMKDNRAVIGRIVKTTDTILRVNQNPYDPTQYIELSRDDIMERELSPVSIMPPRLFHRLNEQEVVDLLAYLISGGNSEHVCYTHDDGCEARYNEE